MENKELIKLIENSDIDSRIKEFLFDALVIESKGNRRYKNQYEKLIDNYVGDRL